MYVFQASRLSGAFAVSFREGILGKVLDSILTRKKASSETQLGVKDNHSPVFSTWDGKNPFYKLTLSEARVTICRFHTDFHCDSVKHGGCHFWHIMMNYFGVNQGEARSHLSSTTTWKWPLKTLNTPRYIFQWPIDLPSQGWLRVEDVEDHVLRFHEIIGRFFWWFSEDCCLELKEDISWNLEIHLGVSKNGGTPKWMVYSGKPYFSMDDLGVPWFFGNTHLVFHSVEPGRFRNLMSTAAGQKFLNENLHRTSVLSPGTKTFFGVVPRVYRYIPLSFWIY